MEEIKLSGSNGYKGRKYPAGHSSIVYLTDGWYHKNDELSVVKIRGSYYRKNSPKVVELCSAYYGSNYYELKEYCYETSNGWFSSGDSKTNVYLTNEAGHLEEKELDPLDSSRTRRVTAISQSHLRVSVIIDDNFNKWFVKLDSSHGFIHKNNPSLVKIKSYRLSMEEYFTLFGGSRWKEVVSAYIEKKVRKKPGLIEKELFCVKGEEVLYKEELLYNDSIFRGDDGEIIMSIKEFCEMSLEDQYKFILERYKFVSMISVSRERRIEIYNQLIGIGISKEEALIISGGSSEENKDEYTYSRRTRRGINADILGTATTSIIVNSTTLNQTKSHSINMLEQCVNDIMLYRVNRRIVSSDTKICKAFYSELLKSSINVDFDELIEILYSDRRIKRYLDAVGDYYKPSRNPIYINSNYRTEGGNFLLHESSDRELSVSQTKRELGGMGYTFGVELETSYGILPVSLIERNGLKAVGDRSVGALEYVTKPLHGDKGMKTLEELCDDLGKFCLVDSRCGVHVHIGGSSKTDSPSFNRRFSIYAIKLGLILQEQMFSLVHPDRDKNVNRDGLSYCGRIDSSYKKINMSNWRDYLGRYVFGTSYSEEHNSRSRLFRWNTSRYKWLNLVNCNTDNSGRSDAGSNSGFKTIEFRIWDGTLNYEDIKNFVRISMAFTKFVDCHQKEIDLHGESLTLEYVVSSTMNKNIASEVINWIEKRNK